MSIFLSPLSAPVFGGASPGRSIFNGEVSPTPPRGFKPIKGEPKNVSFSRFKPPKSSGTTAAQKAGLRYEKRVVEALVDRFGPALWTQKAISFSDNSGLRAAIPDALIRMGDDLAIVEVKYSHCELAWWQLRKLYEPLLQRLTCARIRLIEVCYNYDPYVLFPEEHVIIPDIEAWYSSVPIQVLPWRI